MLRHLASYEPRTPRAVTSTRRAAQLFGALVALALGSGALIGPPAQAAAFCGDRGEILKRLEQSHEETPQALGPSSDGGVLEVLVSPSGGWTILVTYPKRPTCVVAVGEAWQALRMTGGEGA